LASGSGDGTVRIWDVDTETPRFVLKGHQDWVLAVAWSPNGKRVASGDKQGVVRIWDPVEGVKHGKPLKGHTKYITALAWEPMITGVNCTRVASASADGTIKIWDTVRQLCELTLSGHTKAVNDVKWGGQGLLYSCSTDRTIKVWDTKLGKLVRTLEGHANRVNCMSLSTQYALRTGPYDHQGNAPTDEKEVAEACKRKYTAALSGGRELLASASDDFTLFLWDPTSTKKPIERMTGHHQPINVVSYSPDGRWIASASFDKSVKLWSGSTGKFTASFFGHVERVYQVCWSSDSRLLVSGSRDSTLKVWSLKTKKLQVDLPGHSDEVYAVDWSPDGERVASGGKDKVLKIWRT